ncbi:MAG TPA: protein translocase subunit SecF [Candidatus Paceibacterota bacterium]|nr:protein translocase subunit SecF [Candidatus Paceibacterota bacterium]
MFIVKHKYFFVGLSLIMFLLSCFSIFHYGLNLGIDFKGGSIMEIDYNDVRPDVTAVKEALSSLNIGETVVQETGDKGLLIKMRDLKEGERVSVVKALAINGAKFDEKRFDSIGPVIGEEMSRKAVVAIVLVSIMIALFIAFAFRHVSQPVSSFKYGIAALIALLHDTVIPTGIMAYMGAKYGTEMDLLFVSAILAILGISVHDTIVVFDRTRENLKNKVSKSFEETVGISLNQTFVRSINTSATTIFTLLALYFLGGESTKTFSLILAVGVFFGTYSSVFLASPLLLLMEGWQGKRKK